MKKSLFRRIFWLYAFAMLAAGAAIEIYITQAVKESYIENLRKYLSAQINLISNTISFDQANQDTL